MDQKDLEVSTEQQDRMTKNETDIKALINSSSILISFSTALKLKQTLLEIFRASDANNNMTDLNGFKSALQAYIPSLTNEIKIRGIFNALDANQDSSISYDEFLSDKNFYSFLKFCGYILLKTPSEVQSSSMSTIAEQTNDYMTEFRKLISQQNMDEDIIIRLQCKENEISELQSWIMNIGQPAIKKLQQTHSNISENQKMQKEEELKQQMSGSLQLIVSTNGMEDENIYLQNMNKKLVDEKFALIKKIKKLEKKTEEQNRDIFSLHTKLLKKSEIISDQKMTIRNMENETEVHYNDNYYDNNDALNNIFPLEISEESPIETQQLSIYSHRSEEMALGTHECSLDVPDISHTSLAPVTSGQEHNYDCDIPLPFQRIVSETSNSSIVVALNDEILYQMNSESVQFVNYAHPETDDNEQQWENDARYNSLLQYTQKLERKLNDQRYKHEKEKNRLRIESENAIRNEMEYRMERKIERERDRIQIFEEKRYNQMKEKYERKYELLVNKYERKSKMNALNVETIDVLPDENVGLLADEREIEDDSILSCCLCFGYSIC